MGADGKPANAALIASLMALGAAIGWNVWKSQPDQPSGNKMESPYFRLKNLKP
jgi:hypothetical protein